MKQDSINEIPEWITTKIENYKFEVITLEECECLIYKAQLSNNDIGLYGP